MASETKRKEVLADIMHWVSSYTKDISYEQWPQNAMGV